MLTRLEAGKIRQEAWEDCLLSQVPSIKVSEISRILVNLRKNCLNQGKSKGFNGLHTAYIKAIEDTRKALELRKRSRVFKNIRNHGKMDRRSK